MDIEFAVKSIALEYKSIRLLYSNFNKSERKNCFIWPKLTLKLALYIVDRATTSKKY